MKKRPISKTNKSALDALLSALILLATSPATQQVFALLALMTFALRGVML